LKDKLPPELKKACFERDGWACRHCHNRNGLHPHHLTYRSQGGQHTLDNLLTLCWKCHRAEHDGFLKITVVEVCSKFEGSYTVTFEKLRGWQP